MKTATVIFVALTVFSGLFLESSSAPNLFGIVPGSQNNIVEGVAKILETIFGSVEDVLGLTHNLKKILKGANPEIKEALIGPSEDLITHLMFFSDAIKICDVGYIEKNCKPLNGALEKFKTLLAQLSEKYGDVAEIKYLLEKVAKLVADIVTKLVEEFIALLKKILDGIQNDLVNELKKIFAGILKELGKAEASGDDVTKIGELLRILFENIENTVEMNKAVLEAITTGNLHKLLSLIAGCESNMAELKQLCLHANLPDGIKNKLTKVFELIDVMLAKLKSNMEILKKVLKALTPIIEVLLNGLKDIFSKGILDIADFLKKIKEAIAAAEGEYKELLIIIEGLLKKLLEKFFDIIKAIEALVVNGTDESQNYLVEHLKKASEIIYRIEIECGKGIGKELSLSGLVKGVIRSLEFLIF